MAACGTPGHLLTFEVGQRRLDSGHFLSWHHLNSPVELMPSPPSNPDLVGCCKDFQASVHSSWNTSPHCLVVKLRFLNWGWTWPPASGVGAICAHIWVLPALDHREQAWGLCGKVVTGGHDSDDQALSLQTAATSQHSVLLICLELTLDLHVTLRQGHHGDLFSRADC